MNASIASEEPLGNDHLKVVKRCTILLPVDGDHGDGEQRYSNVGVLCERLHDAPCRLGLVLTDAVDEAVHTEWHGQHHERQVGHAQTAPLNQQRFSQQFS